MFRKIFRFIANKIYWFKCAFIYKFNIIDTGLSTGYHDPDKIMLHGMMAILCDFIERENGGEEDIKNQIDSLEDLIAEDEKFFESGSKQADTLIEIYAIYHWWKYERPKVEKEIDEICTDYMKNAKNIRKLEEELFKKDQEMLHRLIEVRPSLWT